MDNSNTRHEMLTLTSESEDLLEIHRKSFQSVVNGGILLDHFMSLEHGLQFLELFLQISECKNLMDGMKDLVPHVKQKLYSLSHLKIDESLFMKLDREYSDLREQMKNVIIQPGSNTYHELFPKYFYAFDYHQMRDDLYQIIKDLERANCKAHQTKELKDISNMLSLLEPVCEYASDLRMFDFDKPWYKLFDEHEKDKKILSTVAAVMERVACFVYLSAVGKMNDEMIISLKNISSDLILEETQIMEMYLSFDVDSTVKLKSHISMLLRLLGWNKRCYLGIELGEAIGDHFTSIQHGLQYLVEILEVSENEDLKLRVVHLLYLLYL